MERNGEEGGARENHPSLSVTVQSGSSTLTRIANQTIKARMMMSRGKASNPSSPDLIKQNRVPFPFAMKISKVKSDFYFIVNLIWVIE